VTLRRILLAAVCMMFAQLALSLVRPMTSYRVLELGGSAALVGWLAAAFAVAPLVLALPAARWAAGRTLGVLAVVGCAVLVAGCLLLAVSTSVWQLAIGSILLGAGNLGQLIAYQSVVAAESDEADYDRNFGWYAAGASVGQLVGPVLGTSLFEWSGTGARASTAAILVGASAAAAGLAVTVPVVRGIRMGHVPAAGRPRTRSLVVRTLVSPGAKASLYVSLVGMATMDLLTVYLPVLGDRAGLAPSVVGLLLAVRGSFSLLSRLVLGTLVARYSRRSILLVTLTGASAAIVAVPLLTQPLAVAVLMALLGLAIGVGQPVSLAWSMSVVPEENHSTAIALRLMGNRLGQLLVPAAAAVVVTVAGPETAFVLMGGMLATGVGAVGRAPRGCSDGSTG